MSRKILIVSDAWEPQINGVVQTLSKTTQNLTEMGHQVTLITPDLLSTIPCPTYPEIRLDLKPVKRVRQIFERVQPESIHIATEGPLGLAARRYCHYHQLPFTTSFHTRFPEYVYARLGIPTGLTYRLLRWFHRMAEKVMVPTPSIQRDLETRGFKNLVCWTRGVDTRLFRPREKGFLPDPRPIFMYVGRVAVEKNIEAFLALNLPGTQYVVGAGPQLDLLKQKYPKVRFVGTKTGEELASYYAAADVLVFPSTTDTFGLVILEALASGVPVAAYPVAGPLDVIGNSNAGCLDDMLEIAAMKALQINPQKCRDYALNFSWQASTQQFLNNLCFFKTA